MTALKTIFSLLGMLLLTSIHAQPGKAITIGTKEALLSKMLNEQREVWVHVPGNVKKSATTQRYPVVYVLDGNEHFHPLSGLIHQLSATSGNTLLPEMIVVAILNTDRTRDLTITHKTNGPYVDPEFFKNSGGGETFTSFIEKELIPHIDSLYPTAPYRTLIGHSLGGMMVVNTLLNHTDMFDAYVALDPSLWWDDNLLVRQAKKALQEKRFDNKTFYMAIANTMNSDKDTAYWRMDTTPGSLHLRDALELAQLTTSHKQSGLRAAHRYYKEESHQSVPLIGEYDALRFIFDFYKFTTFDRLFEPGFAPDSALTAHYTMLSAKMGYTVLPPETLVNDLGHAFIDTRMLDKAERMFQMNLRNYPKSAVVYTGMGDLYAAKNNAKSAMNYYKKSLNLNPDPELRKKMLKLETK